MLETHSSPLTSLKITIRTKAKTIALLSLIFLGLWLLLPELSLSFTNPQVKTSKNLWLMKQTNSWRFRGNRVTLYGEALNQDLDCRQESKPPEDKPEKLIFCLSMTNLSRTIRSSLKQIEFPLIQMATLSLTGWTQSINQEIRNLIEIFIDIQILIILIIKFKTLNKHQMII